MIIDIHTHTFPEKIAARTLEKLGAVAQIRPFTDGTSKGLKASMEEAGIDRSIVLPVATSPTQVVKINDSAARNNESEEKLFSLGCIHPDFEDYRTELKRIKALGLKGFKIHPVYQGRDIDDISYLRIFDEAASLGLCVITHAGLDIGFPGVVHCSPKMCRHVVSEIGSFPFVLAHMGGWHNWEEVPDQLAGTGVYLDTAFSVTEASPLPGARIPYTLSTEEFMTLYQAFGEDHLLFGTDSPWSSQKESLDQLKSMPLTDRQLELLLGGNAMRLLGEQP